MDGLQTAVSEGTAAANRPIAAMLAEFACGLDDRAVPDRVMERARLHILDCIGIALASTGYEFGRRTIDAMRGLAGEGPSPVIGTDIRLPMRDAALVNGTLIHGLDYDDTHSDGVVHASVSALSAALAQGFASGVRAGTCWQPIWSASRRRRGSARRPRADSMFAGTIRPGSWARSARR